MKILIADGKQKAAEQLRKDFKVPDRRSVEYDKPVMVGVK